MKGTKITLFIISIVVLSLFYFINGMTVSPGTVSGNGNPALIVVAILLPLFILMIWLWGRVLRAHSISQCSLIVGLILTFIHLTLALIYQRISLENYRGVIKDAIIEKGMQADDQYIQDITSGITIHVNNQYFNLNTFFMFISFSIFIALLFYLRDLQEHKRANRSLKR